MRSTILSWGLIFQITRKPCNQQYSLAYPLAKTSRLLHLFMHFVYGNSKDYEEEKRQTELEKLGMELNLQNIALTFVPSFSDTASEANLNKINPAVENTIIMYRNRTIIDKFINLKPTEENFRLLMYQLDTNKGAYFDLKEISH